MMTSQTARRLALALALACAGAFGLPGCLDPLVDDEVEAESLLLPAGTVVPALEEDESLAAQVDANDGVDRLVLRRSAFVGGERVWYWTFGPAPATVIPIYYLVEGDGYGTDEQLDHPGVIDAVPGDPGYSPFWQVYNVRTTAAYDGEVVTSFPAIQEGLRRGLFEAIEPTRTYVNCPIVHRDVRLDMGGGETSAPGALYYDGRAASVFGFGPVLPLGDDDRVPVADVYLLRREGGEPLSEPMRGVDMTGDGDRNDSNNIFGVGRDDDGYTPLWRPVEVVVPTDVASIDTNQDETAADLRAAGDLFTFDGAERDPIVGQVVAARDTDQLVNCPLATEDGGL